MGGNAGPAMAIGLLRAFTPKETQWASNASRLESSSATSQSHNAA
jgi:hypothetical protein